MNNEQFEQPKRIRKEIKVIGTPKMKVYLSGAITNDPNHKEKFERAKTEYVAKGYEVLSPIETEAYKTKQSNDKCLFEAIKLLNDTDILIQLDNPKKSEGMRIEEAIADYCNITKIKAW